MTLKNRLLASIENHGVCDISGVYKLYPHEREADVMGCLLELQQEGWVRLKKTRVVEGLTMKIPNVKRTRKQLYTQQTLITE